MALGVDCNCYRKCEICTIMFGILALARFQSSLLWFNGYLLIIVCKMAYKCEVYYYIYIYTKRDEKVSCILNFRSILVTYSPLRRRQSTLRLQLNPPRPSSAFVR